MGGPLKTYRTARAVGTVAGLAVTALWLWAGFFASRTDLMEAGPPLWLAMGIFGGIGLVGGLAAGRGAPLVTALAGFISLVPVGLYLMFLPGAFRWIGVGDLTLLAAGLVQLRTDPGPDDGSRGSVGPA